MSIEFGSIPRPSVTSEDLDAVRAAIDSDECKVVFAGTSITEGHVAQMEGYNIWPEQFMRSLSNRFPNTTFSWVNFGLTSRRLDLFIDPTYVALAAEPGDINDGFYRAFNQYAWQTPSVIGKSWIDHLKDESPDLVVLKFGINSNSRTPAEFKTDLETAISTIRGWDKVPSICILTEILPTLDSAPYEDNVGRIKLKNDKVRLSLKENQAALIDVEKQWQLLRTGQSPLDINQHRLSLDNFTQITGGTPADTLTFDTIAEAAATVNYAYQKDTAYNCDITGDYNPNAVGSVGQMGIRFKVGDTWNTGVAVQILNASVKIFEDGVNTQTDAHAEITVGVNNPFQITIVDDQLTVKINGNTVSSYTIQDKLDVGNASIGVNDATISSCNYMLTKEYPVVKTPKYTGNELLGNKTATDWNNGDFSDGGNSLNHPSRIGLTEGFYPLIQNFISNL